MKVYDADNDEFHYVADGGERFVLPYGEDD